MSSHNGYIDQRKQNTALYTPKNIIIVIFIQALSSRHWRCFTRKRSVIKANIKQSDLEPVVADQVNQLGRFRRDRLLIEEHQQTIQPLGRNAVRVWPQGEEDDFFLSGSTAGASVTGTFTIIAGGGGVAMDGNLSSGLAG